MAQHKPVTPARVAFDAGCTPYAPDFGDVYHSADGGPAQAAHVFLAGNGLPQRWRGRRSFVVLETGFGLGLNFLSTVAAMALDPAAPARLHYVAVEKHPPCSEDLERAQAQWPMLGRFASELRRQWPPPLAGYHRIEIAAGRTTLTLLLGDATEMLAELDPIRPDAIYLDGFAPEKNPGMWSEALFGQIGRLSGPETTAATWSVAAAVRSGLSAAGFRVDKRPGFGRKREMLAAARSSGGAHFDRSASGRRAVVVGAGLAGSWTAHALARRGWEIELIERHAQPAQEASGNPVGALLPALNLADNENARLARAAFLFTVRTLERETAWSDLWARTGLLHLAMNARQAGRMREILAAQRFPPDFVRWADAAEAAHLAEHRVCGPGWWIPAGGWVQPERLSQALLAAVGTRVVTRFGSTAHRVVRHADGWKVLDRGGGLIGQAPTVVLANALGAAQLGIDRIPKLISVRGQVSYLPAADTRRVGIVVCGDGYVAPLPGGGHCVGSTFEPDSGALELRADDHARNLARAERMLPGYASGIGPRELSGRVGLRTATADRLPACGELSLFGPDAAPEPGLHLLAGLGARGLIWAPLCAEILASQLDAEPNPVEASLVAAISPNR